mgnify:CR=1 FL=1
MLPNLLHPVVIQIQVLLREDGVMDDDYREPVQQPAYADAVSAPGQVHWGQDERLRSTLAGAELESDGYILFRRVDLRNVGIDELKQNDRFISIGSGANARAVDLYIVGLRLIGHYSDQQGASMVKAYFRDRFPSRSKRGPR